MLKLVLRPPDKWDEIQEKIDDYDLTIGEMLYISITMIDMCLSTLNGLDKDMTKQMLINHFGDDDDATSKH